MLPHDARDVADVGAGTGKLTSGLVAEGRTITAIDPDPQMLAGSRSGSRHPDPRRYGGGSAAAGCVDGCRGFRSGMALGRPAARVGRGRAGAAARWDARVDLEHPGYAEPWVRELTETMHTSDAEDLIAAAVRSWGSRSGRSSMGRSLDGDVHGGFARRTRRLAQLPHHGDPERRNEVLAGVRSLGERVRDAEGASRCPTSPTPTGQVGREQATA